ncbi:V-set and immunoglobulin domain-containing protein 4-like [Lissotriton helveticus]
MGNFRLSLLEGVAHLAIRHSKLLVLSDLNIHLEDSLLKDAVDLRQVFQELQLDLRTEFSLSVKEDVHGTWRSSVILPCSYSPVHSTPHSVTWRMDVQIILLRDDTGDHTFLTKHTGRLSLPKKRQGGDISLTIMNLQIYDGGQYSCEVSMMLNGTSDMLKNEAFINLDVRKVVVTKPLIQPEGSLLEVSEGATVNLTCSAEGSPPITYRWYKRDQAPGRQGVFQSRGVVLLIENFQTSYSGTYYCEAENRIPTKTRQQSDELHLSVTDDTVPQVTTPNSGMGSMEGTVPTKGSGSTHRTEAPSSTNASGECSSPPSPKIVKTILHTSETHANGARGFHKDPQGKHTPHTHLTHTHTHNSSASEGLPLYYIILTIVLRLAFVFILIVAVVIQRYRKKTSSE